MYFSYWNLNPSLSERESKVWQKLEDLSVPTVTRKRGMPNGDTIYVLHVDTSAGLGIDAPKRRGRVEEASVLIVEG